MKGTKAINPLKKFLDQYKTKEKGVFTHTWLGYPKASYDIPDDKLEELFQLLYQRMFVDKKDAYLTEKPYPVSSFKIDLDFRYEMEVNTRQHTPALIKEVIELYHQLIQEYLNVPAEQLKAYVFERKCGYKFKGYTRDGVHIMYPEVVAPVEVQHLIRKKVLEACEPIFSKLPLKNGYDDVVDRAVIADNNWLAYGCTKPNLPAYEITAVYDQQLQECPIPNDHLHLLKLLSNYNPAKDQFVVPIREDKQEIVEQYKNSKGQKGVSKPRGAVRKNKIVRRNYLDRFNNTSMEEVRVLMKMVGAWRSENYQDWIQVGWCLHNIDYSLLSDWIEFSQQSEKYDDGECPKRWAQFRNEGYNIGSLHRWARQDNPAEYELYLRNTLTAHIEKSVTCTTTDVATVVHEMYKYDYVCISYKHNGWYEFRNHRWRETDSGISLKKHLANEVINEYLRLITYYNQSAIGEKDEHKDQFLVKCKQLTDVTYKLRDYTFKEKVMKECAVMFYDEGFMGKLDTNPHLIGFNNGVFDLKHHEFRDGRPEDFISISTGNDYIEFDGNDEQIEEIYEFMSQIFPIDRVRDYVLLLFSSFLLGCNPDEKFHVWTGCHEKDAPIMMADGSIKKVQDIKEGEQLMGDDSTPRNVLRLIRGFGDMYRVKPVKGDPYVVNGDHIMCLKATTIGSLSWREKPRSYSLSWQEKDINGYPINKTKCFPTRHKDKVFYRKNVTYYDSKEDAEQAALVYREVVMNDPNHIKNGDIIEIPVREYLKRIKKLGARNYFAYRVAWNFPGQKVDLDPYMMGYWLGDGNSNASAITTMDQEVVDYFEYQADQIGLESRIYDKGNNQAKTYYYSTCSAGKAKRNDPNNVFLNALKKHQVFGNKHIPTAYLHNDRTTRMELLAGLIDSDGHYQAKMNQYEFIQKSERLVDDVIYLARSLGFACYKKQIQKTCTNGKDGPVMGTYYRTQIFGRGLDEIPVLLERKKGQPRIMNKDPLRYSISFEPLDNGEYFGFQLDKNHRYLAGDATVQHNCGSNGKSKLIELFEGSFGKYCAKLPVTLLTQKRTASSSATPELARLRGARFCSLQEPDENERINIGQMKELTGGDVIMARGLHRDPIEFKPQFKMVLCCNHLPKVPPNDEGSWRRIRVVDFISKFCDEPDPNNPYEFPKDHYLSEKLTEWREAFMYILLQHHQVYREHGIVEPPEVKEATREYQRMSDVYVEFKDEYMIEDPTSVIKLDECYNRFKTWFRSSQDGKCPPRRDFKSNLEKHLKCKYNLRVGWKGWAFLEEPTGLEDSGPTENHVPSITPKLKKQPGPTPCLIAESPGQTPLPSAAVAPTATPSGKMKLQTPPVLTQSTTTIKTVKQI